MSFWKKGQKHLNKINNSRINLIIAIIFLLSGLIIFKLFDLQVLNYELYYNLASDQHQIYNLLAPERGRIFIQNDEAGFANQPYPIATNKNFYILFAVPKELEAKTAQPIAEQLYVIFKQDQTEKEVDDLLKKEDEDRLKAQIDALGDLNDEKNKAKQAEIIANHQRLLVDAKFLEIKKIRRAAEINLRKTGIIDGYLKKLEKPDDVYEPLEQKVDEIILKKFYLAVSSSAEKPDDLEIENNALYIMNHGVKRKLAIAGLGFSEKSYRFYPEGNIGSNLLGFVGFVGNQEKGRYGLEEYFDQELYGRPGSIKVERDARGQAIIINDREYLKPENGADLILTLNRSIQFTACQKLNEAVEKFGADGGSVIIMEPKTGAIIAMCSNPDYDGNEYQKVKDIKVFTNPAVFSQYEPGSIFKVLTMAMALDQEKITPQTTYEDTGQVKIADRTIENSDHKANGVQTMTEVLEKSLNTGAIFAMRQIGPDIFSDYVKKFGFGEKTGLELTGESKGDINNLYKKPRELYAAQASFGQGVSLTPLQMVSALGAIANNGILMKPYLVKEIIKPDGTKIETSPKVIRRVISEKAATMLGGMMVNVVENGHGKKAAVKGYYVGGKTGTAQVARQDGRGYEANINIGSFGGFAPVDDPKFVMLARIDHPRNVEWAESSAAPLFGELAEYMLNYWQVPKTR